MLRKILAPSVAVSAAMLPLSTNVLAWGCGGWSRSGSGTFTGRYGNTYSANWSRGGGFGGGGWNRYGSGSVTGPYGNTYSRSYAGSGYYGGGSVAGMSPVHRARPT